PLPIGDGSSSSCAARECGRPPTALGPLRSARGSWSKAMRRVLCVWFPTFSTDLARRRLTRASSEPGEPEEWGRRKVETTAIILTRAVASREMVARRCAVCAAVGIRVGMDLAHARSLVPAKVDLHIESHREERDQAALHAIACRAIRYAPL